MTSPTLSGQPEGPDDAFGPGSHDSHEAGKPSSPSVSIPIAMLLYCPKCGLQHIDEPDERTPDWTNPPHKSHLCHGCGCIWRPADVPTEGVAHLATIGKADTWEQPRAYLTYPDVAPVDELTNALRDLVRWKAFSHPDAADAFTRAALALHKGAAS